MQSCIKDSRVTFGTKLSPRMWIDNNGQLICRDVILGRTGEYEYLESELIPGGDESKIVKVYREDKEVFDPCSIASFENKPFTDNHPEDDVTLDNYRELSNGYVRDVRRGSGEYSNCLLGDIVVTDKTVIDEIQSGKRELSLGYNTQIVKGDDGKYYMTNIRGNHLALVDNGRAGCATIRDSAMKFRTNNGGPSRMRTFGNTSKRRLYDEDIIEVEELNEDEDVVLEEIQDEDEFIPSPEKPCVQDEDKFDIIIDLLKQLVAQQTPKMDAEPVVEKTAEKEVVEEDVSEMPEEDAEEVEQLLDADTMEEDEEESEIVAKDSKSTKNSAVSAYSKLAKVGDRKSVDATADVAKIWQERYDRAAQGFRG